MLKYTVIAGVVFWSLSFPAEAGASTTLDLSGADWRIHEDADGQGAERRLFEADVASAGWIPATVPGNIQADLEAAHQLKPLWYGAGDPRMHEAARKDWWYRKDFTVPQSFAGRRVVLVFDGVDHECDVWLNGRKLGSNAGMFRRFDFDVADVLRPGETNRLAVRIARIPEVLVPVILGADAPNGAGVGNAVQTPRKLLRELKSPTNGAWDWSVAVYTLGIWKDVRLEATGPARIEWVRVRTDLSDQYRTATVRAELEVDSPTDLAVQASFHVAHGQSQAARAIDVTLKKGQSRIAAELPLENPALWWPHGHGAQPLYELQAELTATGSGELVDRRTTRFGVREVRWEQCPQAPADFINPLKLVVNGRPVRQLGSNLLPPDALFGRIARRGTRLIELARAAGINCLRLWGGGVILPDDMYDRADELGIMLLQEFPLANCRPETDPVSMANLETTITNVVKQLRSHPAIVEWDGGNEMAWKNGDRHPALQLLERIVREQDGRIFRATEPAQGSGHHGSYTYVYHTAPAPYLSWLGARHLNLYQRYNASSARKLDMRLSEFGTNSPAHLEVWQREIPPASQWPLQDYEDPILIRKNVFHGALIAQNWLHKEIVESVFGPADGLEQLVRAGQFLGAEGLRYAMDALRRNGPALGGGFMSWNYNEPWPNGAGSYMIDYDGRPLMNYDFVRQALAPVALSLQYDSLLYDRAAGVKAELFLTSDAPRRVADLRWRWTARDRHGQVFADGQGTATIEPIEVRSLGTIELKPPEGTNGGPLFIELRLEDGAGKLLTERLHVFGPDGVAGPLAGLLKNHESDPTVDRPDVWRPVRRTTLHVAASPLRADGAQEVLELQVKNAGTMTALFCEPHPLSAYRTDLFIDNNQCFIPPGESRTITIRAAPSSARLLTGEGAGARASDLSLSQTGWWISCWNADAVTVAPSADVWLAVGRRDQMCREFAGYFDRSEIKDRKQPRLEGTRPDPSPLPYLLDAQHSARFEFPLTKAQAERRARLRIQTADQSQEVRAEVEVTVNGQSFKQTLPAGLGIQAAEPAHLAFPATLVFELPRGLLRAGPNGLEVRIDNHGWFTWDAMDLIGQN